MTPKSTEFENFDRTMRELIKVPHEEIKKQLDAEKNAKKLRPRKRRDGRTSGKS